MFLKKIVLYKIVNILNNNMNKFYCIIKNIIWSMNIKYAFIIFYDIE